MKLTKLDIADLIDRLLEKRWLRSHEWDEFVSEPLKDPELEATRRECSEIGVTHASMNRNEWVTERGKERLRELAARLRAAQERPE
jgi:hypothetical protein